MDSSTAGETSATYQCIACQSTCLTPNELHRHQSYRHTSEELSLSIIGIHNAAIRTFDLPNGVVYDNSWLYDPRRHAEFYIYSANMLCDDNNNGSIIDYAFKDFENRVANESRSVAVPDNKDCTHDVDGAIHEKNKNENFVWPQNFKDSGVGQSKILDLRVKIDSRIKTEIPMDTARDHFWDCREVHSRKLGRNEKKFASSGHCTIKTSVQSLNVDELQTRVPNCFSAKILELGQKKFSEVQSETGTDNATGHFGDYRDGLCGDSKNLRRNVAKKSEHPQIKTGVKVQNFDEPQSCVQIPVILDLSQKFSLEVQPDFCMNTSSDNFGKCYVGIRSAIENLRRGAAKRRSSPSKCPIKSKLRQPTMPRMKLDSLKQEATKPKNSKSRESGNVNPVEQGSQASQDSLSWFESEASKIKKYNNKVKQIRASQKKALDLTKVQHKQIKGEGSRKAKKRTTPSCVRRDAVGPSKHIDCVDSLGFNGKEATISVMCPQKAKRPRVSRKKEKICETKVDKYAKESAELPKTPLNNETGPIRIAQHIAENVSAIGSVQFQSIFKSEKSNFQVRPAINAKKLRVSWKKEKIIKTEVDNSADLSKRLPKEESTGKTMITQHSEHSSGVSSNESLFEFESKKPKIRAVTSRIAKKPSLLKKKGEISGTLAHTSTPPPTRPPKEETFGETEITLNSTEDSSIIESVRSMFNSENIKSNSHLTTSGKAKKLRKSKKTRKISKTEVENSPDEIADLLQKLFEEEPAGETLIIQNQHNGNENLAEHSSIFGSAESTFYCDVKEAKFDMVSSIIARNPSDSKGKAKNLQHAEEEPDKRESTKPADRYCVKDVGYQVNWDFESEDSPASSAKITQKIANEENNNSTKQSSCFSRDVFSFTDSESEEATITPISKFRSERSGPSGTKPRKINAGFENHAEHDSNYVPNVYTWANRANRKAEPLKTLGKKSKMMEAGVENWDERNSNFVTNVYTSRNSARKQGKISMPFEGKYKKQQVTRKNSTIAETRSYKPVVGETARGPKLFCHDFGREIFVSHTSPSIIDVNSSTESGNEEEMPRNSSAGNFEKSIIVRNKPKNLKTEVEPALQETSENRKEDNAISLYKDSSLIPSGSSVCDKELPPVTFVAYPPYVDENSILVLNPESRELVWRSLATEDSQLSGTPSCRWVDKGSHPNFFETGKATTSRNDDGEKSAAFVPAAPISNEDLTLQKTNVIRRSARLRKIIQRYNF